MNVALTRPTKLRTPETQARYALAEKDPDFITKAPAIRTFPNWKIIVASYPYDAIATTHHLLCPKRRFAQIEEATYTELKELLAIQHTIENDYDACQLNFPKTQSLPAHLHYHLLIYEIL